MNAPNCHRAQRPAPTCRDRTDAIATMDLKMSTGHAQVRGITFGET
jgi:hypothetical protein